MRFDEEARAWSISIHLLRAEQDRGSGAAIAAREYFNPLAPCGARPQVDYLCDTIVSFQSTCSVRSKTTICLLQTTSSEFQSTCSVRSKTSVSRSMPSAKLFQSTCSVRSKTCACYNNHDGRVISIHLLRAEQDGISVWIHHVAIIFQSTCSVRSKTLYHGDVLVQRLISIHLLRAEQDTTLLWRQFLPLISIHLLRAEQDMIIARFMLAILYFNPLAPCGARRG